MATAYRHLILWVSRSGLRQVSVEVESLSALDLMLDHAPPPGLLGAMRLRRAPDDTLEWWSELSREWRPVVDRDGKPSSSPLDAPAWLPEQPRARRRSKRKAVALSPFELASLARGGNPWAEGRRA